MSKNSSITQEEELRRAIRAEIEQREKERYKARRQQEVKRLAQTEIEKRQKIYQEELRRFYQNRPGYREIIGEDGEVDWVPEDQIEEDNKLFDEVLEDPNVAKKWLRLSLIFIFLMVAVIGAVTYLVLHEGNGEIQVITNVPGAHVILDTEPQEYTTNTLIAEVPAGTHIITVEKSGYKIAGDPVQKFKLKGGETKIISFMLVPDEKPTTSSDSAGPDNSPGDKPQP